MILLLSSVILASLLGSLHCAAMCGPLAALATGRTRSDHSLSGQRTLPVLTNARHLVAYNVGRLTIYCILGAISGSVGVAVDLGGTVAGAQRLAAIIAGIVLISAGIVALVGARVQPRWLTAGISWLGARVHRRVASWPSAVRPVAVGALSGLLPCGWLYAFVLIAGGTASAFWGAAVMLAFWMGTLPIMLSLGFGLQRVFHFARERIPVLTSIAMIAIGLLAVLWRIDLPGTSVRGELAQPTNISESIQAVASIDTIEPPCCHRGEER